MHAAALTTARRAASACTQNGSMLHRSASLLPALSSVPSSLSSSSCSPLLSAPSPSLLTPSVSVRHASTTKSAKAILKAKAKAEEKAARKQAINEGSALGLIRRFKATTPGKRHLVLLRQPQLWRGRPVRALTIGLRKTGGRDNTGRMRMESRGGGNKRLYRFIDFKRSAVFDEQGIVQRLEYDPNRNAHIALVQYRNGVLSYIIAPDGLAPGDTVMSSRKKALDLRPGNCMPLSNIPIGTVVHNVELAPGHGGQLSRSAGTSCTLLDKNGRPGYGLVQLASKEQRYVHLHCMATVGTVSNPLHKLIKLGKAGRARWAGRRPHVRGCARNPVDHPMGGGHNAKGRQPCSKFGVLSKGFKTRSKKKWNPLIVVRRGGIQQGGGARIKQS